MQSFELASNNNVSEKKNWKSWIGCRIWAGRCKFDVSNSFKEKYLYYFSYNCCCRFIGNEHRQLIGNCRFYPNFFQDWCVNSLFAMLRLRLILQYFYFYHFVLYVSVVKDPKRYRLFLCLIIKTSLQLISLYGELKFS